MRFRYACVFALAWLLPTGAAAQTLECPGGAKSASIRGKVIGPAGHIKPWMPIRIVARDNGERVIAAGADGTYATPELCPGVYTVQTGTGRSPSSVTITLRPGEQAQTHLIAETDGVMRLTLATIALFAVGLLLFRHHNIVRSNRELLLAQAENLVLRIPFEADQDGHSADVQTLVERAHEVRRSVGQWAIVEWFFWSRGRELAGWQRLHELERQVIAFLVPEQRVVERAVYAEAELREMKQGSSDVLADRMRQTIQEVVASGSNDPGHGGHALEHLKQQLAEGLAILYDDSDTKFAGMMEWHNKAMFLVYLSLLGIAALALVFHHEELFLIGAVGGLMSRMARSLLRADVPSDYGASWTTLFLSPLLGAISAWAGIALIIWLREMNILDEALFGQIDWHRPTDAVMIAMAFTLGFSERLFTSLLSRVEGKVTDEMNRPPRPPAPPGPLAGLTGPATTGGAGGAGAASGAPPVTRNERILRELDLKAGERAAFVGDPTSATLAAITRVVGAANVFKSTPTTLAAAAPLDGVLFETMPAFADLPAVAAQLAQAVRPDGRVVFIGSTPAALFDADAATQRQQHHAGPAVVKQTVVASSGMVAQDPPEKLGGTDPVEWIEAFVKPAPGGADR